ncbi:MAG TPA: ribonuclease HI [Elusimicrobiota bacterium]|nr:ribonuclease HI [Elusimicrobiota bacterium]
MVSITIYADGAAKGNPGPGGYGTVLISGSHRKELSGGFRRTTNNRMELLSVIIGLESLRIKHSQVTVYSDSRYVVDSVEKGWLESWLKTGFRKKKNADLWLRFMDVYRNHRVKMVWVKGHAENRENNRCDELAVQAAEGKGLETDEGYERSVGTGDLFVPEDPSCRRR